MEVFFNFIGENWISFILFLIFWFLQWYFGQRHTDSSCRRLRHLFPDNFATDASDIPQIAHQEGHPLYQEICGKINNYIIRNNESIELGEMKDIVNRILDKEYEMATTKLSVPMFLGLIGTYVGVVVGLFMLDIEMLEGGNTTFANEAISQFIGGIIVAMATSGTGLLMTMFGNREAATLEKELEDGKDRFFTFLQTDIIPDLPTTLVQTLQESLHKPIHELGEVVGSLNQQLKETFCQVTEGFGKSLTQNLDRLDKTIGRIFDSTNQQEKILKRQGELVNLINGPHFSRLLERIVNTTEQMEERVMKLQHGGEAFLQLQQRSSEIQHALIDAQERSLQVVQGMDQATIASAERFCELIREPQQLYLHMESTLKEFEHFQGFIAQFVAAEEQDKMQYIERIDKQLQAISDAGGVIQEYVESAEKELASLLDKQQNALKEAVRSLGDSWQKFFEQSAITPTQYPFVQPQQIQEIGELLSRIERRVERLAPALEEVYRYKPHEEKAGQKNWISKLFKRTR